MREPDDNDDNDDNVRRLHEAEDELYAVQQRGVRLTPLLDRLHRHLRENALAERFVAALEHDLRRNT